MPMELDNMSLRDMLLPLFGLKYTVENSVRDLMEKKFEKTNFSYDKKIKNITRRPCEREVFLQIISQTIFILLIRVLIIYSYRNTSRMTVLLK